MGLQGETCGAVTGGVLLIGLKFGSNQLGDDNSKNKVYNKAAEFVGRFYEINGAVRCRTITGLNLSNAKGLDAFHSQKIKEKRCIPAVISAVELAMEIIRE
jgi:C_GCAxxG_C_C family probable redox protein